MSTVTLRDIERMGLSITQYYRELIDPNAVARPKPLPSYTFEGRTLTLSEWSDEYNIKKATVVSRLRIGWPFERAITEPVHPRFGKHLTTGGYQATSSDTTGTGLGSIAVERDHFTTEKKTENHQKAGE